MNKTLIAVAMAAILGFSGLSIAAEDETGSNSLSVPLWIVGDGSVISTPGGAVCSPDSTPTELMAPTGTPLMGYPISPGSSYFVQGISKWQAPCATWDNANGPIDTTAAWGDNLNGSAKLRAGSPIRVEIVLTQDAVETQQGYSVVKLDPAALDRLSPYGTLASNGVNATPTNFVPMVFDSQAWITVEGPTGVIVNEAAGNEINATGKAIYGYNLRVPSAGVYDITYTLPNVNVTAWDIGTCVGQECTVSITVTGGGSGGGKGGAGGGGGGKGGR